MCLLVTLEAESVHRSTPAGMSSNCLPSFLCQIRKTSAWTGASFRARGEPHEDRDAAAGPLNIWDLQVTFHCMTLPETMTFFGWIFFLDSGLLGVNEPWICLVIERKRLSFGSDCLSFSHSTLSVNWGGWWKTQKPQAIAFSTKEPRHPSMAIACPSFKAPKTPGYTCHEKLIHN